MLSDARSWSIAEQSRVRLLAVDAVIGAGVSISEAAWRYGVSVSAVGKWVHAARAASDASMVQLRRGRRVGEVCKLAPWQQAQVVKTICEQNPDQLKLPFALWTREPVRDLVWRRFGVRLAIRTVGDYLRRWGFTPQKPVQRAYERDEAAVQRWLTEAYPRCVRARSAKAHGSSRATRSESAQITPVAARTRQPGRRPSSVRPDDASA